MSYPDVSAQAPSHGPTRRAARPRMPFVTAVVLFTAMCSALMMGLGLPNLLTGDGLWLFAKVCLLTVSASVVAFAVNKIAIERGAPLTVIGYPLAGSVSVAAMLFIGAALFGATYSGLVYKDVSELRLQQHGEALAAQVAARNAAAGKAARIEPAVQTVAADLRAKYTCEVRSSCISGRGSGGYGTVARTVEEKRGKAETIAAQIERGQSARSDVLADLNTLIARYRDVLGDTSRDIMERRGDLQAIDAQIRHKVTDLAEAAPVVLVAAYAEELLTGTSVPERPEATSRLNAILTGHGETLRAVTGSIVNTDAALPAFPGKTGVIDTFGYIPHFLPVAGVAALVDLILPITIWTLTALTLAWRLYRQEQPASRAAPEPDLMLPFYGSDEGVHNHAAKHDWREASVAPPSDQPPMASDFPDHATEHPAPPAYVNGSGGRHANGQGLGGRRPGGPRPPRGTHRR